jgi:hypothetical protein
MGSAALALLVSACGSTQTAPPPLTNSSQGSQNVSSGAGLATANSGTPIYQMNSQTVLNALQNNLTGYGTGQVTAVTDSNYMIDPTYANSSSGQSPLQLIGSPVNDTFSSTQMTVTGSGSNGSYELQLLSSDGSTSQTLNYTNSLYVGPVQLVTTSNTAMFQGQGYANGQTTNVIAKVNNYQNHGSFTVQEFFVNNLGTTWNQGASYPTTTANAGSQLSVHEVDISVNFQFPNYAMSNQGGLGGGNYGQTPNVGIGYQYPTY